MTSRMILHIETMWQAQTNKFDWVRAGILQNRKFYVVSRSHTPILKDREKLEKFTRSQETVKGSGGEDNVVLTC